MLRLLLSLAGRLLDRRTHNRPVGIEARRRDIWPRLRNLSLTWLVGAFNPLQFTFKTVYELTRLRLLILFPQFFHIGLTDVHLLPIIVSETVELNTELLEIVIIDEYDLLFLISVE